MPAAITWLAFEFSPTYCRFSFILFIVHQFDTYYIMSYLLRRFIFTLLAILGCSTLSAKDITIYVATDLHVMSPELIVNEGSAWDKYIESSHKLEDYSVGLFQNMIDSILIQMPDIVLIPGDLSKDGEKVSHEYISQELSRLTNVGIKVYVVPGNHDIGYIENAVYFDGDKRRRAENITAEEFLELYSEFGYDESVRDENSLSYVVEPVNGLVILGIDSHTGKIEAESLEWICQQARKARDNGKQVIAMMHHLIMEHFNNQPITKRDALVSNADSIRSLLLDAGIHVVFTGHFHTTDVAMDYNENHTDSIYDISTCSKISYPMHHRWVNISEDLSKMSINTFITDSIEGHPEVLEVAKDRLAKAIDRNLESNGVSFMASIVKKGTFIHCEGNEHEANGISLIDSIPDLAFVFYPDAWYTLNSVLDDLTFFGGENQNRANDLNLTIHLHNAADEERENPGQGEEEDPGKSDGISYILNDDKPIEPVFNLMGQKYGERAHDFIIRNGRITMQCE